MFPIPSSRPFRLGLLIALSLLLATGTETSATDLGPGNAAVKKRFEAYRAGGHRLAKSAAPRRVLITGFGLFSGVRFNISGVVAASMASPAFWPDQVQLDALPPLPAPTAVKAGILREADHGARGWERTLEIDGRTYRVGFLVLDVRWDLGAAITLWEAQVFRPQLIIMTGRGGAEAVFEAGALNRAAAHPGFGPDGRKDLANRPVGTGVLDPRRLGVEPAIGMTWDNQRLARAARPLIEGMRRGYRVASPKAARHANTYICNNLSCVVLHGLKGRPLALAGGAIQLTTEGLESTRSGFFHYPARASREPAEVRAWAHMLAQVVKTHFTPKPPAAAPPADARHKRPAAPSAPAPGSDAGRPPGSDG